MNHMTKKKHHYFSHGNTRLMLRNMHFVKLCPRGCMWLPLDQTTYKTLFSKLLKPSNIFKHFQILCQNHVKSMDVSLEARRRCSMLLRGAVSLWSSSSWNLALRWGRRVRTASASTARARGILGRSDGWCMLMFQCITIYLYVGGILHFLTPSCLYAELVLILIKTSQSELFLRMMGGVFVWDRREEYNVMLARRCWCKFCWVATFSEIMPNIRDKQTCECDMVHLDTPKVYRKPKAGEA